MTTQATLDSIRGRLNKGKPIPTGDVRALLAVCDALMNLVTNQQTQIAALKKAIPPAPQAARDEPLLPTEV